MTKHDELCCLQVPITQEEIGESLCQTAHAIMGLSASEKACLFQSDGTRIDEGVKIEKVHKGA